MVDWAAGRLQEKFGISFTGYSFYGDTDGKLARYVRLAEPESDISKDALTEMEAALDELLSESNEKYFKYRRWQMLDMAKIVILRKNTYAGYREMLKKQGKVLNQIKPVTVINTDERKEFFFSHAEE